MNLATVIDPGTGHIDAERVRAIEATELDCGCSLEQLISTRRVDVRVHKRALPPGQGRSPDDP